MSNPKILVAGIGPGSAGDMTPAVLEAVRRGYYEPLGAESRAFVCEPGAGSAVVY